MSYVRNSVDLYQTNHQLLCPYWVVMGLRPDLAYSSPKEKDLVTSRNMIIFLDFCRISSHQQWFLMQRQWMKSWNALIMLGNCSLHVTSRLRGKSNGRSQNSAHWCIFIRSHTIATLVMSLDAIGMSPWRRPMASPRTLIRCNCVWRNRNWEQITCHDADP